MLANLVPELNAVAPESPLTTPALPAVPLAVALVSETTLLQTATPVAISLQAPVTATAVIISPTASVDVTATLAALVLPPDLLAPRPGLLAVAPPAGEPCAQSWRALFAWHRCVRRLPSRTYRRGSTIGQSRTGRGAVPDLSRQRRARYKCGCRFPRTVPPPGRKHPRYSSAGESAPGQFSGAARHVECVDCHEPHDLAAGNHVVGSNTRGANLQGSWGVAVSNGLGGATPLFTRIDAVIHEYELCFKCHSGWSTTGRGTDVAAEADPNNRSHHAIEAPGNNQPGAANPNFDATFVYPWSAQSIVACSDCHSGSTSAGPHGSDRQWILRGNETGVGSPAVFCYNCHSRDVYGDVNLQQPPYAALSRFSHPEERDHTALSGEWGANTSGIWCRNCHGSDMPGAIHGTDRGPGEFGATPLGARLMNGQFVQGWTAAAGGTSGQLLGQLPSRRRELPGKL